MNIFRLGIDRDHGAREVLIDPVVDRARAEIGVLAVEAAFGRLIGVFEPVVQSH